MTQPVLVKEWFVQKKHMKNGRKCWMYLGCQICFVRRSDGSLRRWYSKLWKFQLLGLHFSYESKMAIVVLITSICAYLYAPQNFSHNASQLLSSSVITNPQHFSDSSSPFRSRTIFFPPRVITSTWRRVSTSWTPATHLQRLSPCSSATWWWIPPISIVLAQE